MGVTAAMGAATEAEAMAEAAEAAVAEVGAAAAASVAEARQSCGCFWRRRAP